MLTGLKLVFIGGDARQLAVIQRMCELNADITVIGFDDAKISPNRVKYDILHENALLDADALFLPAMGTDEGGYIESCFSMERIRLSEKHFAQFSPQCLIFTGIANLYVRHLSEKYAITLIELFNLDDVAIYNSIPTSEGAVMLAMQNSEITIHGSKTLVLGMGRAGMTLARLLKNMGALVQVGVMTKEQFARAHTMNLAPFYTENLESCVTGVDFVFNTVPALIISEKILASMNRQTVIIDLASAPGGTNFQYATQKGITALLAPGLPGKIAPKTAGIIIAEAVTPFLVEAVVKRRRIE
jgi:dipicolinate synthase subunit A